MIEMVKLSLEELNVINRKKSSNPEKFDLDKIKDSGVHVGEVSDQSEQPKYNLEKLSHSGRHVFDITEEPC